VEAYEALNEAGEIGLQAPKSALFGPIYDWLSNQYRAGKNEFMRLDDSTIRKEIAKQFDIDHSNTE
jgi:hypothetical protein